MSTYSNGAVMELGEINGMICVFCAIRGIHPEEEERKGVDRCFVDTGVSYSRSTLLLAPMATPCNLHMQL